MSNLGTRAECYALFACPNSDVEGFIATVEAKAESSGSGTAYSNSSGHGIIGYSLTALAVASAFSGCSDSLLVSCLADAQSAALCNAGNTPYHTGTDGITKTGKVGGFAQAVALGARICHRAIMQAIAANASAIVRHPVLWGRLACPFYKNQDAVFSGCSGSAGSCLSNDPHWCDNGDCDEL
jgi:hypothetical protein